MAQTGCHSGALLHGKTVIITGANTGIGKETARDLARRGAKVIMACRNLERAFTAANEIKAEAKGEVMVRLLDLASLKSIHNFATQIIESEQRVDILINNAGVFCAKATTEDGFDMQFGTNHLGHFLLTYLLLEKLKSSAPSRIITVASTLHTRGAMEWDDLNMEKPNSYGPIKAYAQSKLANILFTRELARRLKGTEVNAYAVHPGGVRTEMDRHLPKMFPFVLVALYNFATKCFPFLWKTCEEGAQTTIHCTVAEELANQSGLYYSYSMVRARCRSGALLRGKTVIITGANTGIGKETARDLARRGARVIMACRSLERGTAAANDIKNEAEGELVVRLLDLASLKSVRNFARLIIASEERVDILINNAGVFCAKATTEDGFDMQFGTNHLGHFLLTYLLLDKLKSSTPSRIITVASALHSHGAMEWDDLNMDKPNSYSPLKAYAQSKLANILFTRELARRLKDSAVTAYAVHPGAVLTEIDRHFPDTFPLIFVAIYHLATKCFPCFWKTCKQGAQTTIHCAVAEELANQSGFYYSDCRMKRPARQAMDDEAARKLWDISLQMTGIQNY